MVRFTVTVNREGSIEKIELVSGHPLLVEAAREALMQYKYKPTLLNGNPIAVTATVDVEFKL
jgi:periplasmic protein TonB